MPAMYRDRRATAHGSAVPPSGLAADCAGMVMRRAHLGGVILAAALGMPGSARAQEMEPRAFTPSPVGVDFFLVGYARSTGGILTDPSLPVDDVEATVNAGVVGYGRTFGFFGHLANIGFVQPWMSGHFTGTLNGEDAEASRSGIGDLKVRFATNLIGGPALTLAEFAKRKPTTTLGVS